MRKLSYLLLLLLFCNPFLLAEEIDIFFRYGLVAIESTNEDSIYIIEENTILKKGDKIRLNLEYQKGNFFYVLYHSSNEEIQMLFSSTSYNIKTESDSIFTALSWMEIEHTRAEERFYMISSNEQLINLENNYKNYINSRGKNKQKFYRQIENEIANLQISKFSNKKTSLVNRLEKPVIGGVTFRGKINITLIEQSLTHKCKGKTVAVATFIIRK
jgi:hypothetical protein